MNLILVYENEKYVLALLMPLLNVKFTKEDLEGFIKKIYEKTSKEEF